MNALPPGTRVLIVEDQPLIAMLAGDMIEHKGGVVAATAFSLAEAIACARDGAFDVAMLDISLKGELSLPVAELLRERGKPFLFVTGYGTDGGAGAFTSAEILRKPYMEHDLGHALCRALGING